MLLDTDGRLSLPNVTLNKKMMKFHIKNHNSKKIFLTSMAWRFSSVINITKSNNFPFQHCCSNIWQAMTRGGSSSFYETWNLKYTFFQLCLLIFCLNLLAEELSLFTGYAGCLKPWMATFLEMVTIQCVYLDYCVWFGHQKEHLAL